MATRSFLVEEEISHGREILLGGAKFPEITGHRRKFSTWLAKKLDEKLHAIGDFDALEPLRLGSWSRNELCPKSDIDLLFLGPEEKVKTFVGAAFRQGLKLRARTPEDREDLSKGVEPFDILALQAQESQRPLVHKFRKKIFSAIRKEREERRKRQDSVSSFLEPNLKFGSGGLRDIEQALQLKSLFQSLFADQDEYPFTVLNEIKEEFLFLRSLLHLQGSGDILTAHDQLEFVKLLGAGSHQEFMKHIQSQLERASFYADWAVEVIRAGGKVKRERFPITLAPALQRLKNDPGILTQFEVRRRVEDLNKPLEDHDKGRALLKALSGEATDEFLVSLYRTRLLELWIPDFKNLRGLVQHDHYHRYTADAHLIQTLRQVERARTKSKQFGPIGKLAKEFTSGDWWTLKLTALFHDLAKGRQGDHSSEGAQLVEKYFKAWDYPEALKDDVKWLVANHLILSTAAFRQNPQSQSTWKRLFERGVEGRRLNLLALFTAIDIRATNADAWTDWKSQLLMDLVQSLHSPQARKLQTHLDYAKKNRIPHADEWMLALDPGVLESFSPKILVGDLKDAALSAQDLPVRVIATGKKAKAQIWVRFHRKKDERGVFLGLVKRLYGFGLSIQTASVHTLPGIGVYDWFCLRTDKPARQISQWLNLPTTTNPEVPKVSFQSIDLMSNDNDEWIFSFRGRDQRGLLLAAADALDSERLSLRWARAHTWGGQVDDIFSVQPLGEVEKVLERLQRRFVT